MKKSRRPGPERLHQQVARKIGSAILSGEFAPGEHLVGEVLQSAAMGVSRTAYREAMKILAAKGLIESRPKAGTNVTPRSRWALLDPDVLAWTFTGEPDPAYVRDLFELRGVIEPAAAALAAERRSEAQVAGMRARPLTTFWRVSCRFHWTRALMSGSQNFWKTNWGRPT